MAHASVRFFGSILSHAEVDDALVAAMNHSDPWSSDALTDYADALGVCAFPANVEPLGPATVEMVGDVAVIRPGTGDVVLPSEAVAAAIDLRELPAVEGLRDALERAASVVLAEDVPRPRMHIRLHQGLRDEGYSPVYGLSNVYSDVMTHLEQPAIVGTRAQPLPLVVVTAEKLAPEAAAFAIALRSADAAWLVGEDVLASVAEAAWLPVGQSGLVHRTHMLQEALFVPDVIPADRRSLEPLKHMSEVLEEGMPPSLASGGVARDIFHTFDEDLALEDDVHTLAHARAALITLHGAARHFFPYFHTVGDTIDQGLIDELEALETNPFTGPDLVRKPLYRLETHLHDSHGYVFYYGNSSASYGSLPILLDETESGDIVVRRSELPEISPGDVLLSIDGKPIVDFLAEQEPFIPASTPGALRRNTLGAAVRVQDPTTWEVRSPDMTVDTVEFDLTDAATSSEIFNACPRTHGTLEDLGHPELYYINLDGDYYDGTTSVAQLITAAQGSQGLILDGRGYPESMATWYLIERILQAPSVVRFNVPYVTAVSSEMNQTTQSWNPRLNPSYDGPVVVLIGPWTQSQAEHILISMVNTDRAQFVGRQTAGANGNITGVMTPGALGALFTGTEVLFDDGSTFHGVGILPTVEVHPTVEELANGIDPELAAAVELLTGN